MLAGKLNIDQLTINISNVSDSIENNVEVDVDQWRIHRLTYIGIVILETSNIIATYYEKYHQSSLQTVMEFIDSIESENI